MVFGDYVRARGAARALPRTPTQRGRGEQDDTRTTRQCEGNRTIRRCRTQSQDRGQHTPPRHSAGPLSKRKGDTTHKTGRPATQPPFTHYAAPPSTMAPPSTTVRGEHAEDTPPHEQHRHALTTHTPQHPARNSARCELQYSPALQWDE